ncbi:threonine ammonia-lyase [Actinomycetospora straminea]|uniref:Threonine/serine dehydratase n=1 Tax=Actinomycetospora straminea TaxID=663607 RepID=A0ABP9FA28_9PSEU|nr:pyridoxal-phosphate dependent enzyme [Actinomycetospora straminea]MDD7936764.1 pyridoxal-phosphate dependent enzyme [Actinomycetospora straminea]
MTDPALLGPGDVAAAAAVLDGVAVRTAVTDLAPGFAVKREDLQPVGAFKVRGAFHAASRLAPERRAAGLVTHSSGNHGRALAWVARRLGVPCTVVAPDDAVEAKVAAMAELGARLVRVPADERESAADAVVAETGGTLIPPYDHPHVIAGQGTVGAEILADRPDVEQVVVPIGGGGLISGIAAALRGSGVRVIGAEPELAGDAAASRRAGERVRFPREQVAATAADGLRATVLGELTWPHVRDLVADVVTVDEEAIADATRRLHAAGVPCEASGAVATAGWLALPPADRARRTVAVVSGGNVDPAWLARVLADQQERSPVPTFG